MAQNNPGKLWNFWQYTKALVQTPFNSTTRKDAGRFGLATGKTVGTLAAGNLLLMVPVIASTPILPWIVGAAAISFGFKFGREAWERFKGLKETAFVSNYVRRQRDARDDRSKKVGIVAGIKNSIKNTFAKIPTGVMKAAKWLGLTAAVAGVAGAATTLLGQFAAIPALAPVMTTIASVGAAVGLTAGAAVGVAIAASVIAIPVGLLAFKAANNAIISRGSDNNKSPYAFKRKNEDGTPIEQGRVFEGKTKSFDFNDNAPPAKVVKTTDEDAITIARKKAAEERIKNKSRRDNSKKF